MPQTAKKSHLTNHVADFVFTTLALLVLSLSMFCLSMFFNKSQPVVQVLGSQIDLEKEKTFWISVVKTTPTYRDGWLELAKIEKQLGNDKEAEIYIKRATDIDPNFVTTSEE